MLVTSKATYFMEQGLYKTALGDSYEGNWIKGKKDGKELLYQLGIVPGFLE